MCVCVGGGGGERGEFICVCEFICVWGHSNKLTSSRMGKMFTGYYNYEWKSEFQNCTPIN